MHVFILQSHGIILQDGRHPPTWSAPNSSQTSVTDFICLHLLRILPQLYVTT